MRPRSGHNTIHAGEFTNPHPIEGRGMDGKWLLTILILAGLVLGGVVGQLLFDPEYSESKARGEINAAKAALAQAI